MNSRINIESLNWWFWFLILIFIVAAIAGWTPGYYLTMIVSFLNSLNCLYLIQKFRQLKIPVNTSKKFVTFLNKKR